MIYGRSFSRQFYLLTICFCFCFMKVLSLDTSKTKTITYYRFTLGGGLGKGYPQAESQNGVGGTFRAAIQRKKKLYTLGTTGLGEIKILNYSNVNNKISSLEVMYGRVLYANKIFCSISGGLGYINSEETGAFISREGSWLFGYYTYEKIQRSSVGIPISFQTFWVPAKFYGIGLDFYANINSINSFYTVSLCHQFGKLRPSVKKIKEKKEKKLSAPSPTL